MNQPRRKVKVCCFCESWESGGIESFLSNMILQMDHSKVEIDLVTARLGRSVFTQPLRELGIQFYQLSGSTRRVLQNNKAFRSLLAERHYDVLHLNAYQGLSLTYLELARKMGVPIRIAHSHNTALRISPTKPLKLLIHNWAKIRYTKQATALWACAEPAAKFLFSEKELDKRGYIFIQNGIDTERFKFAPEVRNIMRTELQLEEKFVIGNVGRLCFQKNQEFLLEVFREVVNREPGSVLLLIGEGKDKEKLKRKAEQWGLHEKVVFYGATDQIERLYWAMDVFIMPSRFEGLPVTGVEAQASGVPCLFSDAITEECRINGNSRFLSFSAPAIEWAKMILQIRNSENRATGASVVREAGFDMTDVARRIETFYLKAESYG